MKILVARTRDISFVPKSVKIILALSLILQCLWHYSFTRLEIKREALPKPPEASFIKLVSLDDPITAAKLTMLWLQAFDNQPGVSIPLKDLDYENVIEWLNLILDLDKNIQYPLFAAIRFYAEVQDEEKQRRMIDYTSNKFLENPDDRWPFMAHAVYMAKHRIKDVDLAVKIARLIRLHAKGDKVPYWAKQMEIFILEDMGELESARVLLGGLLESGELTDQNQRKFLGQRLEEIEQRQKETH